MLCRYLLETGFFRGSEELTKVASVNCVDKRTFEYADLLGTIGTNHERQSHVELALAAFQEMHDICEELWLPFDVRIARAYNAVTNGLVGAWRAADAVVYGTKAVEYGPREPDLRVQLNPDRYLRCRACAYLYVGDLESAKEDLDEAEYWQDIKHGKDSHYHGEWAFPGSLSLLFFPDSQPPRICKSSNIYSQIRIPLHEGFNARQPA